MNQQQKKTTCKILVLLISAVVMLQAVTGGNGFSAEKEKLEISKAGNSQYVIVIADTADKKRIMQAASLLKRIIKKSSGAELQVMKESEKPADRPAFFLGKTGAAKKAGIDFSKISGWTYVLKTDGKNIFIVGDDAQDIIKGEKRIIEHLGTLKGVTAFLEAQLEVRFLLPGEYGKRIPKYNHLTIDSDINEVGKPCFEYVTGRSPKKDRTFAVALNLFGRTPILKSYGGHSYYTSVPKKVYAKSHPQYFAMRGGIRAPEDNHLCISNPEVHELMLKEMELQLDKGYRWVELAQTDGYMACHCGKCKALHPDEAERLWIVHRKLTEEMKKRRPGKKILLLSYSVTRNPPKSFSSFPDNVVVQVCDYRPEILEAWAKFKVDKTVYIYNWGEYKLPGLGPARTPRYVIEQIQRFLRNGVRGIYICGGFDAGVGYGLNGPALYAFGKALANPELKSDEVLNNYVNSLFGDAAAPMRAFYRGMYDRLDTYSLYNLPNIKTRNLPSSMKTPEDFYCHSFPPKLLKDMTLNLERAKSMNKEPQVQSALKMVEIEFNYIKKIAQIFHIYRAYRAYPTTESFKALAEKMKEWRIFLDSLYDHNGKCSVKISGGLPLTFSFISKATAEMNGRTMGLRPPFNWDFKLLKERGVLPGTGKPKRLEAVKVAPFKLDGNPDKAIWQDIPFQKLSEIGLGDAPNA
ncbi:MAG: DUF4838 domain-containing protein, partial [Planctomycetota bacterium]